MKIPTELLERRQWVCRDAAKVPYNPRTGQKARANDPSTWVSYREACTGLGKYHGLAFVISADDPYTLIDLDDAFTSTEGLPHTKAFAGEVVALLNSFSEVSPSGRGIHILVKAKLPPGRRKDPRIEFYDSVRVVSVTGDHMAGTLTTIEPRQKEIEHLHSVVFPEPVVQAAAPKRVPAPASDVELVERARQHGRFAQAWDGDCSAWSAADGKRPDRSRADAYLVGRLAFWTQGNAERIDTLFRQSGLMRPKWDEQRGPATYGQNLIAYVLRGYTG